MKKVSSVKVSHLVKVSSVCILESGEGVDVCTFLVCTGCPRKFVPHLPEDYEKVAKGPHHTFNLQMFN